MVNPIVLLLFPQIQACVCVGIHIPSPKMKQSYSGHNHPQIERRNKKVLVIFKNSLHPSSTPTKVHNHLFCFMFLSCCSCENQEVFGGDYTIDPIKSITKKSPSILAYIVVQWCLSSRLVWSGHGTGWGQGYVLSCYWALVAAAVAGRSCRTMGSKFGELIWGGEGC